MKIREIQQEDNRAVGEMIRSVLTELAVPQEGTAFADRSLNAMFEAYSENGSKYFVVEKAGRIMGGSGISPLSGSKNHICELQKMYFLPEIRGCGAGSRMIEHCLAYAVRSGYKSCYLETLAAMTAAQRLYVKKGFRYLDGPLGNTGHYTCDIWMIKEL